MVTYQTWTSIAFEVADSKGMESSQENSAELVSVVAEIWQERKADLSSATRKEAEDIAQEEITVR